MVSLDAINSARARARANMAHLRISSRSNLWIPNALFKYNEI
jgi:hypothetical protein